jgi:3'-5' exoribonuclease
MKDFFIADAPRFENAVVTSFFVLSSLQIRERRDGGQFLKLTLTDKTGSFPAVMWEDFADVIAPCTEGCYVKVMGQSRGIRVAFRYRCRSFDSPPSPKSTPQTISR